MGGLGPGIGGSELIVIGLVALLVVGPKDLPLLMRRVGQFVAKARGMANEFRASFDEMARQSELDDLRKEVEALRRGQGMHPLGDEAAAAFKDINQSLNAPITTPSLPAPSEPATSAASKWPDTAAETVAASEPAKAAPKRKRAAKAAATTADAAPVRKTTAKVAARKAVATPAPAPEAAKPAKVAKPRAKAASKPAAATRKRTPKS
ncbi:MAG: twin-arginine translocase subunit TatB [Brevundimonas sp.]|nr:MAG: twin-arginine translocase subunit TatB [Brevundimonas sp.]